MLCLAFMKLSCFESVSCCWVEDIVKVGRLLVAGKEH
jgi:hypothetical protein